MKKIYFQFLAMTLLVVNIAFAADEIHWTVTGKGSVTFDWRGAATENLIGYGLSSGNYTQVIATKPNPVPVSSSGPFWEAKLTGLTENTSYYYKIGNGPERSFRTGLAPGSSDFNVYAQGNIGSTSTYFNMGVVQDLIASDLPAFVVGLGDLTLGNTNGKAAVDQHFNDVMMWSTKAAYMPVWGDRDTVASTNENFKNYKGRFAVPNSQTSPGSPLAGGEDWYWFDYGNVRFITLPEPWTGAWNDWMTKASVLMAQAQNDSNIKFIVTFVHRPAYSSGHTIGSSTLKGKLDALGDAYSKYKLNVNAQSNNYERSFPQHGVTHVTAGTGGADLTQDGACLWLTCTKPAWTAFRSMHLGALKLHFTASGIQGSFICGPEGGGINDVTCIKGSVIDSFVIGTLPVVPPPVVPPTVDACTRTAINVANITGGSDGWLYRVMSSFGTAPDNSNNPTQSTLRLFENGVEIGPAHTYLSDLLNTGLGKFQHWSLPDGTGESLWFTASDNTDPRTNGKLYSYCTTGSSTTGGTAPVVTAPPVVIITGPTISAVSAFNTTQTDAKITWTLNEGSTGQVEYGTTTSYGQVSVKEPSFLYTTHEQTLSGLVPGTQYHFRVRSTNQAGVESVSGDLTFTTSGTPPVVTAPPAVIITPAISGVSAFDITQTDAKITWILKEGSTGQVEYGTTTSYGNTSAKEPSFLYTTHVQTLSGLAPGMLYHFRVRSTNQAGVESVSGDFTFTTDVGATLLPTIGGDTIPLITDGMAVFNETTVSRPLYLSPMTESTFKTKVTRVAGNMGTSISFSQGGSDTWDAYARHSYSKQQPWNADQSLLMIDNANRRIYLDGATYQPKFTDGPNHYSRGDDRWHPTLPNIRVNVAGALLEWYDVVNGNQARNWQLPLTPNYGMGSGEGNTSSNGRYVALANAIQMIIVDMDPQSPLASYASGNKRIGPAKTISDCGMTDCSIDWVSVSPSGKYAIVKYNAHPPRVYDINSTTLALTVRPLPVGSPTCTPGDHTQGFLVNIGHADMTMNPFDNNEDVIIGQQQSGCPAGSSVTMIRLRDNAVTPLTTGTTATMSHLSARNLQRPGWVYVTYLDPANYQWDTSGLRYSGELVAVKIDGSGSVERLAYTHSYNLGNYNAQEHGVPSPDGKRVLWASNWSLDGNGSTSDIKDYVADTRP